MEVPPRRAVTWLESVGLDAYTSTWLDVEGGDIIAGRNFTYAENTTAARVAVINDKLAEQLFPGSDPLDKMITISGVQFRMNAEAGNNAGRAGDGHG